MNCQEVMELMHRQLDGDLSDDELDVLMNHTRQCPECAATFERLKHLSAELASLPKVTPRYSLVDAILPELERIELLSTQPASVQPPAALPPEEQSVSTRRLQRKRRWPSWSAIGSVVAAGIVAGFFILNAQTDFDLDSSNQAAELSTDISVADSANSSAMRKAPAGVSAGGDLPMDDMEIRSFTSELPVTDIANEVKPDLNSGDTYKETETTEPANNEEAEILESTGQSEGGSQGSVGAPGTDGSVADPASGGEGEIQDQYGEGVEPSFGIAAFAEIPSPDGRYIARIEEFSIIIESADNGETMMESPRKNGQHGQLVWSENGTELYYDVQLDQGAIEKYVIQTSDWTEAKAPH